MLTATIWADNHILVSSLADDLEGWGFFAVLDGHAGKLVADATAETLTGAFWGKTPLERKAVYYLLISRYAPTDQVLLQVAPVRSNPVAVCQALALAFLQHDANLLADIGPRCGKLIRPYARSRALNHSP